ncbi:hypothetical protein [Embleya sp. NPDC020886]|uniref:MmyB family transcriptional regulator n=1 Tax=Embleya sp. NPDC020886 TaxID=3363980 RepID=UPI003792952A
MLFLDPDGRAFYPDREKAARNTVASLRSGAGDDPGDPVLISLVGELSVRRPDFARLWARHEVRAKSAEAKRFRHSKVGELVLSYESLTVNSAPGQQLVVYQAEPGSPTEESLRLLGSLSATPPNRPCGPADRQNGGTANRRTRGGDTPSIRETSPRARPDAAGMATDTAGDHDGGHRLAAARQARGSDP